MDYRELNTPSTSGAPVPDQELEQIIRRWNMDREEAATLRSLSRLLVGSALVGYDELLQALRAWEDETRRTIVEQKERGRPVRVPGAVSTPPASPSTVLRYAALGLLFENQDRWLRLGRAAVNFFDRSTERLFSPAYRRMNDGRRLRPVRSRFEKLVRKGETVTGRWVQRGRVEEAYSRRFARTAGQQGFDASMDQLGSAPALQDLVRKQSTGLTQDALDEVRERTVSGDYVAEHLARSLLRRVVGRSVPPSAIEAELQEAE